VGNRVDIWGELVYNAKKMEDYWLREPAALSADDRQNLRVSYENIADQSQPDLHAKQYGKNIFVVIFPV
jgi:hypothetical protein